MKKYQRRSASEWQSLVTEQLESDLSAPAFCKDRSISYPSFISWKKKLADSNSSETATFVEITPFETESTASNSPALPASIQPCIEVDMGPGMQLRIYTH